MPISELPPNPTVTVIFHGLQCFYFDGKEKPCMVGLHNRTHGAQGTHPHRHDLTISVLKETGGTAQPPVMPPHNFHSPKNAGEIDIHVSGEMDFLDGVYVYEKGGFIRPDPPDDAGNANDTRDWRWVIDFERDVYTAPVSNVDADAVTPSVAINKAIFSTFSRTESRFSLVPAVAGGSDQELGRIAHLIAANIYLKPGEGKVVLKIGRRPPITLEAEPNTRYEINITNDCNEGVSPACAFDRGSPRANNRHLRKEERNDFYLYYDIFDPPVGEPEFELVRTARPPALRIEGLISEKIKDDLMSTDEAPCGGSTNGQSGKPGDG
ncbi:MAG TPA: hypothetical protein VNI02_09605 [Blastocatellia bacterium]|nr:hypothetical protein [Blastocatellia bacterium]